MSANYPEPYSHHPQPVPPGYGYPVEPYPRVAPKSPGLALLASFFVPGLGSLIIGRIGVGIGIMVGYFVAVLFSLVLIGLPFLFGFWVWGMCDAYSGARKWNARHGIIS